jgi:hypothetical protein
LDSSCCTATCETAFWFKRPNRLGRNVPDPPF